MTKEWRPCQVGENGRMVPEAPVEQTEHGLVPTGDGWFVLNSEEGRWLQREGRGWRCPFEGEQRFDQVGVSLYLLEPGEPMAMYHWEADQEDFLVIDGEALLLVEGEERPLRRWDFVHCPPETEHTIVGAGEGRCIRLGLGARERSEGDRPGWGGYRVNETALRHRAGVERETVDPAEAYARFPEPRVARFPGWR